MDAFTTLLEEPDNFTNFAVQIGKFAGEGKASNCYRSFLNRLNKIQSSGKKKQKDSLKKAYKVITGICLLIACESKEKEQQKLLEDFIGKTLERSKSFASHDDITYFILCELAYLDQYLVSFDLRNILRGKIQERFSGFPKSVPYMDYEAGWRLTDRIEQSRIQHSPIPVAKTRGIMSRNKPNKDAGELQIIFVGSIKGGVGKTVTSLALVDFLLQRDKQSRVALIDLDASGPTVQYNFDVPDVRGALGITSSPEAHRGRRWPYATFADIMTDPLNNHNQIGSINAADLCLRVSGFSEGERLRVVLLPDSPTVTGIHVTSKYFNAFDRAEILIALKKLLDTLAQLKSERFTHVVLDLGPGLFGTNGAFFTWLTQRFSSSLILVSSPRSFDIANSVYEGVWLSAPGYQKWRCPVLQFLNMCRPEDYDIQSKMGHLVDTCFETVLSQNPSAGKQRTTLLGLTSRNHILFWRLRSYLYKLSIDSAARRGRATPLIIKPLPLDSKINDLLYTTARGQVDFEVLRESDWYRKFFCPVVAHWVES